jgi:5'-nucleotidase
VKILVTNDDGILAPGLGALCRYLAAENEVFVVAPDNERSGVSQSITYRRPVFHKGFRLPGGIEGFAINGYPVDCVKVALHSLCPFRPEVVVSGINSGLNVGLNVGHSGTVAGALAASVFGLPAVALSLEEQAEMSYGEAAARVWPVCANLLRSTELSGKVLNVNVPTAALEGEPRFALTPVNCNNMGFYFQEGLDPKNRPWLWQTNDPAPAPLADCCDVRLAADGWITISPLSVDLTCRTTLASLAGHPVFGNAKVDDAKAAAIAANGNGHGRRRVFPSTDHSP